MATKTSSECQCQRCGNEMEEWRDELCGDCVEYCDCCGQQLEVDQIGLCDDCQDEDEEAELEVEESVQVEIGKAP